MAMDMFSFVPDHLLVFIISFLAFREAARTSVLSRRWCHIWRSTHSISFNERYFINADANQEVQRDVFVNFVRNWMQYYREPFIEKFSLTMSKPNEFLVLVEDCIRFALRLNAKALGLDFSDPSWGEEEIVMHRNNPVPPTFDLPQYFYHHRVLESLTLIYCKFNVSEIINLRALKHISLGWIELRPPVLRDLLDNLRSLESLSLENCWNDYGLRITGRDLRLRSLVIKRFMMFESPYIEIAARNLKYFKYSGRLAQLDADHIRELEEADLEFDLENSCNEGCGDLLYQLLHDIPTIRVLTICTYMLQVLPLEMMSNGDSPWLSVENLTMKTGMYRCEQDGIHYFLNSCRDLEVLTIDIGPRRIVGENNEGIEGDMWRSPGTQVYQCVDRKLKIVEVKGYKGRRHENSFLRYLILRGGVLEKLDIHLSKEARFTRSREETRALVGRWFDVLERASNNLQVTIHL